MAGLPWQPISSDSELEKQKQSGFNPFMQALSQQDKEKDKANKWLEEGAPNSPAVQAAADAKADAPMSKETGKMIGDIGSAGISAIASMLAALGKSKLARESEELKAGAQAKANVLSAEQRLKTGNAANRADIMRQLVETAGLMRR